MGIGGYIIEVDAYRKLNILEEIWFRDSSDIILIMFMF
jgi:hypothetical protein